MKLLHTNTLQLEDFVDESYRPEYAILSHTWGEEEILYEDIIKPANDWSHKKGAGKILESCKVARSEQYGHDWIWIDTCCIDKKSSSELSEAINSMYKWYAESRVCIAYLADVDVKDKTLLKESRWFTRGWTLQELIAPNHLDFWDQNWNIISARCEIASQIAEITHIDVRILESDHAREYLLDSYSVAEIMSWAALRHTTRREDMAYCLLGLFRVNMPLLYGEGGVTAFHRLQMAIIENSEDPSILAWERGDSPRFSFRETLARAPLDFRKGGMVQRTYLSQDNWEAEMSGPQTSIMATRGDIALDLIVCPCEERPGVSDESSGMDLFFGVLNCAVQGHHQLARPALLLDRVSDTGDFVRADVQLYILSPDSCEGVPTLRQDQPQLRRYKACIEDWHFERVSLSVGFKIGRGPSEDRSRRLEVLDISDQDSEKCVVIRQYGVRYCLGDEGTDVHIGGIVSLRKHGYGRIFVLWILTGHKDKYKCLVASASQLRKLVSGMGIDVILADEDFKYDPVWLYQPIQGLASYHRASSRTIRSGSKKRKIIATITTRKFLGSSAPELRIKVKLLNSDTPSMRVNEPDL